MNEATRMTSIGMLCPACRVDLVMSERQNIEIDYCPKCRGVWLDRGELDKIIEKSMTQQPTSQSASPEADRGHGKYGHGRDSGQGDRGHRRRSWLQEILD